MIDQDNVVRAIILSVRKIKRPVAILPALSGANIKEQILAHFPKGKEVVISRQAYQTLEQEVNEFGTPVGHSALTGIYGSTDNAEVFRLNKIGKREILVFYASDALLTELENP